MGSVEVLVFKEDEPQNHRDDKVAQHDGKTLRNGRGIRRRDPPGDGYVGRVASAFEAYKAARAPY